MSEGNGKPKKVHICLGMPSYGTLTGGAAQGFYRSSNRPNHELQLWSLNSSLLALNFNRLWCWALNESRNGKCDFFAMQHADIEPEEFWLPKLIDELEARDLDVLGVVAPIKSIEGTTSTALAHPDPASWRPLCRLTMKEVYRLPETFTSEDEGHPVMINTGLWVCRFREEWARRCHFEINDEIRYDPEKGIYFPVNEPEDWNFSRQLYDLNLKVGCTRKVKLGHRGEMAFSNTRGWGEWDYDRAYGLSASVLDERYPPDWFPADVEGWLSDAEGRELARLAAGKRVLEIGSYCGRSTICLAQHAERVHCIDTFDGRGTPQPRPTLDAFAGNLERYGVAGKVAVFEGTTDDAAARLADAQYDLVFIDGAHDRESVENDIRHARRLLKPGGLLAFHDYKLYAGEGFDGMWNPGVALAVNGLLAAGAELLGRFDSLAVVRPPANVPSLVED